MEKVVIVDKLVKNYEVLKKGKGFIGSLTSLIKPEKTIVRALKGITFSLGQGEIIGFIGPNGAGKTTTLKILSGLLYPTSGFVQILGYDPWERKTDYLKQISLVMGQKNQLWWDLPALDSFELNRAIYEIPERTYNKNLDELVNLLDVGKLLDTPVRKLSLGQRMRLELVASLLHKPRVLFLDEPTIGLDVVAQKKVRDFLSQYVKRNGSTIILTSHDMDDLVNLTKRVVVIEKGDLVFDGNFRELVTEYAKNRIIKVYLSGESDLKKFEEIGKIRKLDFPQVTLEVDRSTSAIAAAEILQSFPVADLTVEEEPIEDVVRRIFKRKLKGI